MRRRARLLAAALPLLASTGCVFPAIISAFTDTLGREAALVDQQRSYTKLVRWNDFEAASEFVHPEMRDEFLSYENAFSQFRVTEFEIGKIQFNEDNTAATVRVTYHAYSMLSMVERQVKETQEWERTGKGNTWWVRAAMGGRTEGFAGVAPAAAPAAIDPGAQP